MPEEMENRFMASINNNAVQRGFCTPGMIMSAKALLDENSGPTIFWIGVGPR